MKTYSVTDIGQKRKTNQDYVYCRKEKLGILPNLFIVADGMGGHNAGDFASRFAVEEFVRQVGEGEGKTLIQTMEEAVNRANRLLIEQAEERPELKGMGTTFVAATIDGEDMYVANIGDSRLYLIGQEEIMQITQDHSLVEEMIRRGELRREEARFHPNKNVITRAMGANVGVVPDFFEVPLREGDIILLCSDGLSNMMDDREIFSVVRQNQGDIEKAGSELLRLANEHGGRDNISIVLVGECAGDGKDYAEMR
ncbi:MAG: Stp1/IreP family PP2C-type Ser/Thr phosphatase [Lachnospiraceae bacterium]|nr:Stp1/IreP family PP2C-type Ser/Thr phosphatase [Lachnospiraceae bacterium]